jgi:disulfide bond formation protein DsbB
MEIIINSIKEDTSMRKLLLILSLMMVLALFITSCGGDEAEEPAEPVSTGDATAGEPLFNSTCSACHGPDAKGMPNLGKDLTTSEFLKERSDAEMLDFVLIGRTAGDPLNDTGVDMPPRGGNPALSNDDIYDIIAYLRTLEE